MESMPLHLLGQPLGVEIICGGIYSVPYGSIDQEFGIATTTSPMSNTSGSLGLLSKLGYLCWMVILVFSV